MSVVMATKEQQDISIADISFDLERLFDLYNLDHIPFEKRLDQFKQRDLAHIKHYKAAVKIFGGPPVRTRVIVAPPMETPFKHRLGDYINKVSSPPALTLNGTLRSPPQPRKQISDEVKNKLEEDEKRDNYQQWMARRRKLQENLEHFNFSEQLLERKINKSELEMRVQERLRAARLWKPEQPPPLEVIPSPKPLPSIPVVAVPPPEGLQILDKFLSLNRMRLMDLFLLADKDKSWSISREKLLSLVSKAEIPLSESEVDDLMITLDTNADNKLDYQELFRGLTQWRKQRRDIKKQEQITITSSTPEDNIVQCKSRSIDVHSTQDVSAVYNKTRHSPDFHMKNVKRQAAQSEPPSGLSFNKDLSQLSSKEKDFETTDYEPHVNSNERFMYKPTSQEMSVTLIEPEEDIDEMNNDVHFLLEQSDQEGINSVSMPKVRVSTQGFETVTDEESADKPKARVKSSKSSCSGSHVTSSRSHTSGSNSLEVPEPDLREETRVPESAEAMMDHRKLSRVVLSRNSVKRNLSPVERLTFDEIPGVIKIGYKPIDDHCSESTLGGEAADKVNQFRQEKLKEYYEVKKQFLERGLPFTQDILDKVLLYPGDRPTKHIQAGLIESFNATRGSAKKTEKKLFKGTNSDTRISGLGSSTKSAEGAVRIKSGNPDFFGSKKLGGKHKASEQFEKAQTQRRRKHKYYAVEDVYPLASRVKHKEQEEELSSGTALIKSKLDNWMTFEDYSKYTKRFHSKFSRGKHWSDPQADWTGHLLNKLYLCMDHDFNRVDGRGHPIRNRDSSAYNGLGVGMYNGRGNALFHETRQLKRAYPGYNNDLLTWPVGENGVRYGSIDEHRIIR